MPSFTAPRPAHHRLPASLTRRPRRLVALTLIALLVVDHLTGLAGSSTVPGGPLDEVAHLLTMLIVLWALRIPLTTRFARAALVMSVLIDVDHVPGRLGDQFLTAGTPRPYTHSLLTVLILLLLAVGPRWRPLFLGAAFGLVVHLWRDLSESGSAVSLFWPITRHSTHVSHTGYLVTMAVLGAVALMRAESRVEGEPASSARRPEAATGRSATVSPASPSSLPPREELDTGAGGRGGRRPADRVVLGRRRGT